MSDALVADRARVADLETQILDLERTLAALRREKTAVQGRLDAFQYPILTLPNEITSEIFINFLPPYPICPPITGLLSPTFLTQICHKWREIARSTPALWRAISLSFDDRIPFRYPAHILDILSRSGCCPLSIELRDHKGDDSGPKALQAALAHRKRWEYLKLDAWGSDLPAIEGTLPLLHHVDLKFDDYPPDIDIHHAPLLRTAILNTLDLSNVILPWAQLTSLTVVRLSPDKCFPILQQVCNLVHCKLSLYNFDDDENNRPPDVTLPRLESLVCTDLDFGVYDGYINTIIVPALRSLQITEALLQPAPIDSLSSFISKSGCKLQEVRIKGIRSVNKGSYLQAFPSIRMFYFDGSCPGDEGPGDENNLNS